MMSRDISKNYDLTKYLKYITKEKKADVVVAMKRLQAELNSVSPGTFEIVNGFHVRFMAHVINLAEKECMAHVHRNIRTVRKIVAAMSSSFKRGVFLRLVKRN